MKGLERFKIDMLTRPNPWFYCPLRQAYINNKVYEYFGLQSLTITDLYVEFHKKSGKDLVRSHKVYEYSGNEEEFWGYYNLPRKRNII